MGLGLVAARVVTVVFALLVGYPITPGGSLMLGLGLAGLVVVRLARGWTERLRAALYVGAVVAAAVGTVVLVGGFGLFLGLPGLVATVVVGVITARLLGRRLGSAGWAAAQHPSRLSTVAAAVGAAVLLGASVPRLAGFPVDRWAAAAEDRLLGQQPSQLTGPGWTYFPGPGGVRLANSRIVVLPAIRDADGHCRNGASYGTPMLRPGSAPFMSFEIAFNPRTCQVALREGAAR